MTLIIYQPVRSTNSSTRVILAADTLVSKNMPDHEGSNERAKIFRIGKMWYAESGNEYQIHKTTRYFPEALKGVKSAELLYDRLVALSEDMQKKRVLFRKEKPVFVFVYSSKGIFFSPEKEVRFLEGGEAFGEYEVADALLNRYHKLRQWGRTLPTINEGLEAVLQASILSTEYYRDVGPPFHIVITNPDNGLYEVSAESKVWKKTKGIIEMENKQLGYLGLSKELNGHKIRKGAKPITMD